MSNNLTLAPYQRVIAVDQENSNLFREDVGRKGSPRSFVIEYVDTARGMFRLFQVGSYSNPLWFDFDGNPCLSGHSRSSNTFKIWKNWRLVDNPQTNV